MKKHVDRWWSRARSLLKEGARLTLSDATYQTLHMHLNAHRMRRAASDTEAVHSQVIAQHVSAGACCLDIGAHVGVWTYPLSCAAGPAGRVYAYEASPYYAAVLERALRRVQAANAYVCDLALASEDGETELVTEDAARRSLIGRIHLRAQGEAATQTETVRTARLDTLAEDDAHLRSVQFIKCDVEGAELFVFEGARHLLETAKPVIFCEVQEEHCQRYGHRADDVLNYLRDLGYDAERQTRIDYLFTP